MANTNSNLTAIADILSTEVVVAVGNHRLTLTHPQAIDTLDVRQMLAAAASGGDAPDAVSSIKLSAAALRACLPGLSEERSIRLVAAVPGGEQSELVATAFRLCGLGAMALGEDGGDVSADPTLSPENSG